MIYRANISAGMIAHILFVLVHVAFNSASSLHFEDESAAWGLDHSMGTTLKYGGASVCDLDGDGWPDLLFGHHDSTFVEVYFNDFVTNSKFTKSKFPVWHDTHGLNGFRIFPWRQTLHFSLSRGGAYGTHPNPPVIFRVFRNRTIVDETSKLRLSSSKGRGRSAIFMNLRPWRKHVRSNDVIFSNAGPINVTAEGHQNAFRGKTNGKFIAERLKGFETNPNWYVAAVDIDDDGQMELVSFHELMIFKISNSFIVSDITQNVLPTDLDFRGTVAIAELDFDNDGRWDLYIARTKTGDLGWLPDGEYRDYLLHNVGGNFVDVSKEVGLPGTNGLSRGVTAGDFNNDGYIDIAVSVFGTQDYVLINQGGKSFRREWIGAQRSPNIPGDMVTAVDLNHDGRLDLVVSEGHTHDQARGGYFKILKNIGDGMGNFLLVRVGSAPKRTTSSLHAVVSVSIENPMTILPQMHTMVRRVGSPGTAVSNSYIEVMHFGLGQVQNVLTVQVRWVDGSVQMRRNVAANSMISIGVFWK